MSALVLLLAASSRLLASEPECFDVFDPEADGFKSIRIPSIVLASDGALLAFAEGRAANADQAKNKIILKRSRDGGRTWGPLAVVADGGDRSLNNPCAVVERDRGRVFVMYQAYPAGIGERNKKIETGYDGEFVVRSYLVTSDDNGVNWSNPRDLTRDVKRPEHVTTLASGPGLAIHLRHGPHAGRMLFPFNEGPYGKWNIYAVFSDDSGQTWKRGDIAPGAMIDGPNGKQASTVNETQLVELKDGSVRLNSRRWAGAAVRKTCVSNDGGFSWSKIEDAKVLADPSCMASIYRYTFPVGGQKSRILFSGPQSTKRENGTVLLSYDEGATWPVKRVLWQGEFAYSVLTALDDGTIGCLFEADGTKRIVFARFTLDWLTGGMDRGQK
ncbi:MAG TPA: sialidase family protein [Pirellulales bacterium]|nr:sialidase family protein [Pirellulales bacterium]